MVEIPENDITQTTLGQNQGLQQQPPLNKEEVEQIEQNNPRPLMVQRNKSVDQVLRYVQLNNFAGQNNITYVVEQILTQNGLIVGYHRPIFIFPLS